MQTQILEIQISTTKNGTWMFTCHFADGNKSNLFTDKSRDPQRHTAGMLAPAVLSQLAQFNVGDTLELSEAIDVWYDENDKWKKIQRVGTQCPELVKVIDPSVNPDYGLNLRLSIGSQAHFLMEHPDTICFDIEATGTNRERDEMVSICIIDTKSRVLLNSLIQPTEAGLKRLKNGNSSEIHGITADMLTDAPSFPNLYPQIRDIMLAKNWLAYNIAYDASLLDSLCDRHLLPRIPRIGTHCAMLLYSEYAQVPNTDKAGYSWIKLQDALEHEKLGEEGDFHSALFDIQMTQKLLVHMAGVAYRDGN